MTDYDRHDGLPAPVWLEFEVLRWEKTPAIQSRYGTFGVYWAWLQAQCGGDFSIIGGIFIVV